MTKIAFTISSTDAADSHCVVLNDFALVGGMYRLDVENPHPIPASEIHTYTLIISLILSRYSFGKHALNRCIKCYEFFKH